MKRFRVFICTDLEGVGGVVNFADWCTPDGYRNEMGCRFLTEEVNAAVDGFFASGATEVVVGDGHGSGGSIRGEILDPRAYLQRGGNNFTDYEALAFVGQHAKAGTPYAHLAHTQTGEAIDFRINGVSLGEFGQLAYIAAEQGKPTIFAAGDKALTLEASTGIPEIITVAVKEGTNPTAPTPEVSTDAVFLQCSGALHYPRRRVLEEMLSGAKAAAEKYRKDFKVFKLPPILGPYVAEAEYRPIGTKLIPRFGKLPARRLKTRPTPTITAAFNEFYGQIEWKAPDGDRVIELKISDLV